ncbi:phosphoribosylanthranilate isomerase [Aquimarina sp. TRL1]|nr:phosphoribosylanthranilate isomerase [Aquimarina sp. TRL1]
MTTPENIKEVAQLAPAYLGFIFYEKSPRNFTGSIPEIPKSIKKTGVFVDAPIAFILDKIKQFDFQAVQLHGTESPVLCHQLKEHHPTIEIFKVFSIKDQFDFSVLTPYEKSVDYFLFDTKGKEKGGNGYTFDWNVLKGYTASIPFILSGGIGIMEISAIKDFLREPQAALLHALDVNSKFEIQPGIKDHALVAEFITEIKKITSPSNTTSKNR